MSTYSLSEALQVFLKESRIKDEMLALQIQDAWENIMGKTIARYTDQVRIHGNKLHIHTKVGPLRNELIYQRETVIQKVNAFLGSVIVNEVIVH